MNNFDSTGVEVMVGKKMFRQKQELAAIRIQAWWRKTKARIWYKLIKEVRMTAADKISRAYRQWKLSRALSPQTVKKTKHKAAVIIQKYMRGRYARDCAIQKLSAKRIESNLAYFEQLKRKI